MKRIPLTRNQVVIVDDADFDSVNEHKWYAHKPGKSRTFYAVRNICLSNGKRTLLYLHRWLMPGINIVDHANGDGLDCRRANLREATHQQNMRNRQVQINSTTGVAGVNKCSNCDRYRARIKINGKEYNLGYYDTVEAATEARRLKEIEIFKEFKR